MEERADLMFGVKVALANASGSAQAGLPATVNLPWVRPRHPAAAGGRGAHHEIEGRGLAVETVAMRKVFGRLVAVDSLDLTIDRGTVFGLLGSNGSGKTTTIRMLCGLLRPAAAGRV